MKKKKTKKSKKERQLEKEILYILGFVVLLVLVFIVASSIFKSFNSFEYEGLTFTKERAGEIPVYHYYYYFLRDGILTQYNLFLRNDPRMNDISVSGDEIDFSSRDLIYLSVDSEGLQQCEQSILAVADLTRFIQENGLEVEGAVLDFWEAGKSGQEWATCEENPESIVIELRAGDKTEIIIDDACHKIMVNNCEILQSTERYIVQSIIDSR